MIKFLHAADFHLDSAFSALPPSEAAARRQEQRQALLDLTQLCSQQQCDILLLAGDLFDAEMVYRDTLDAMEQAFAGCPAQIFIAPGNHDPLRPGSPYLCRRWPDNVHIFSSSQIETVELESCTVSGAAFLHASAPALLRFSAPRDERTHLMVLHGDPLQPDSPYNPIAQEEIAGSNLTYLALGHIHQYGGLRHAGNTAYAWPGCLMGRGFDECGEKGVILGTAEGGALLETRFVPLSTRRYEILRVQAGENPLQSIRAALPPDAPRHIFRIILEGEAPRPDLAALLKELSQDCFALQLRDQTRLPRDLWAGRGEDTLRGQFLQLLYAQLEQADSQRAQQEIELAVRLGLAAMEQQEVALP